MMEGLAHLAIIGAFAGAALSGLLVGVDLTFGSSIMSPDRCAGLMLIFAFVVPLTAAGLILWGEVRQ